MLTPNQQQAIDRHLRQTNLITNEDLLLELTDHFTTAITKRIETGESFGVALTHVQETFGGWPGLMNLQEQYVRGQNRIAWARFRQIVQSYCLTLKLLPTLLIAVGIYWLLISYSQRAFIGLSVLNIIVYIIVCWPAWKWEPDRWQHEWNNTSLDGYLKKMAGTQQVVIVLIIVAFNLPIWLYLFFFPFTFSRSFDGMAAVVSTFGFVASYIGFACVAELTYRQNPLFKRFA